VITNIKVIVGAHLKVILNTYVRYELKFQCIFARKFTNIKRFIAFSLLLLFSIRPAYQVGCYAYYELNLDTIIEELCENTDKPELKCDGKCFLAKQLNIQKQQSESEQPVLLLSEAFFPLFFEAPFLWEHANVFPFLKVCNYKYFITHDSIERELIKPPPKTLA